MNKYAEYLMPKTGGIGLYSNFTHVDVRSNRSRWKNFGKEVAVNGFPGYTEPKVKLTSGNDIVYELMNGQYKIDISDAQRAIKAIDNAKNDEEYLSLYWIIYKIVNKER